jgi:hypothetical protein
MKIKRRISERMAKKGTIRSMKSGQLAARLNRSHSVNIILTVELGGPRGRTAAKITASANGLAAVRAVCLGLSYADTYWAVQFPAYLLQMRSEKYGLDLEGSMNRMPTSRNLASDGALFVTDTDDKLMKL